MTEAHKKKAEQIVEDNRSHVDYVRVDKEGIIKDIAQALADAEPKPSSGWPSEDHIPSLTNNSTEFEEGKRSGIIKEYSYLTKIYLAEVARLEARIAKLREALDFYRRGAGLELTDEGINYGVDYRAYENNFDLDFHIDKEVGTFARLALKADDELAELTKS